MPRLSRLTYSLAASYFCFGAALFVIGPLVTEMAETFHVSVGRVGLAWAFYALGLTPAVLLSGWLCEIIGRRRLLLGSIAFTGAACLFLGLSPALGAVPNLWYLLLAMACFGIGGGALQTVVNAAVADDNRPSSGFALNITFTILAIGAVLGPAGVSALLRIGAPWPYAFYALAALFAVLLVVLWPQPVPDGEDEPLTLATARPLLRTPLLWVLIGATSAYVGAECGLLTWISPYLERQLGAPRALAGLAVSVFWAFMLVGRAATSAASLRFSVETLLVVLSLGAVTGTAAAALSPSVWAGLMGAGAAGLFMSGITPLLLTDAAHHFHQHRASVYGLTLTGIGVGSMLSPPLMGAIADAADLRRALLVPPVLLAFVAAVYLARWRRIRAGAALAGENK